MHTPSGTLIAADLIWDYPKSGTPKGTQAWKFGMDQVYRPFYNNLMIKDKGQSSSYNRLFAGESRTGFSHVWCTFAEDDMCTTGGSELVALVYVIRHVLNMRK